MPHHHFFKDWLDAVPLSAPREMLRATAVDALSTLVFVAASRPTVTVWPFTVVDTPFVPETVSFDS